MYVRILALKLLKDTIAHAKELYKKTQIKKQAAVSEEAIAKSTASTQPSQQMIAVELQKLFNLFQQGAISRKNTWHRKIN